MAYEYWVLLWIEIFRTHEHILVVRILLRFELLLIWEVVDYVWALIFFKLFLFWSHQILNFTTRDLHDVIFDACKRRSIREPLWFDSMNALDAFKTWKFFTSIFVILAIYMGSYESVEDNLPLLVDYRDFTSDVHAHPCGAIFCPELVHLTVDSQVLGGSKI